MPDPPASRIPQTWRDVQTDPIVLTVPKKSHDYLRKEHILGVMPTEVEEYGKPALHVRADLVKIKNFYWSGSMEGLHVGSEPFTGRGMRNTHEPIRVTLDRIFCRDVGEDAISIQPRARVTLKNSEIRGNWMRDFEFSGNKPGLDKLMQIDGATVTIENCIFRNGFTGLRAKANSRIILRNCHFVDCKTAISGDGLDNPRSGNTYDNGHAGLCHIKVENCTFYRCFTLFHAFKGCEIHTKKCVGHRCLWWMKSDEGKVFGK